MRFVLLAAVLLAGGCVEAADLVLPAVQEPAYCATSPDEVAICPSRNALLAEVSPAGGATVP